MKTIKSINNQEVVKRIAKENYYNESDFIADCKRYVKAIKEIRIITSIVNVSASGMQRTVKLREISKANSYGYCLNTFYSFLKVLGYSLDKNGDIKLRGCGMDLIFALNYEICGIIKHLGMISEKEYKIYSQNRIIRM